MRAAALFLKAFLMLWLLVLGVRIAYQIITAEFIRTEDGYCFQAEGNDYCNKKRTQEK